MDTRTKIVSWEELRSRTRGRKLRCIAGAFDPLAAEHARRLAELKDAGELLVVVVKDLANPLLPLSARAELVAALAAADYVVAGCSAGDCEDLRDEEFAARLAARAGFGVQP